MSVASKDSNLIISSSKDITGIILADQVKSLDWRARDATLMAQLPDAVVEEVLQKLLTLLR